MSAIVLIEATWDSDQVGQALQFDPADVEGFNLVNEIVWLNEGNVKRSAELREFDFDTDGWFEGSNIFVDPDPDTYIYVQVRAIEGIAEGSWLLHDAAGEYQWWEDAEDFQPTLGNWRLQAGPA